MSAVFRRSTPAARRQRGFTLMELLVAITLASVAAVLGAAVLKAGVDYIGRARTYLREQEDFHAATRTVRYIWQGRAGEAFIGAPGLVEFTSTRLDVPTALLATRVRMLCLPQEDESYTLHREFLADPKALEKARAALEAAKKDGKPPAPAGSPPAGQPPAAPPPADPKAPVKIEWVKVAEDDLLTGLSVCSFAYLQTVEEKERKIAIWQPAWLDTKAPRLFRLNISLRRGAVPPLIFIAG